MQPSFETIPISELFIDPLFTYKLDNSPPEMALSYTLSKYISFIWPFEPEASIPSFPIFIKEEFLIIKFEKSESIASATTI